MLLGTVVAVTNTHHPPSFQTTTTITGVYDLGGGTMKRTTLNIRSVKSYTAPENPSASALSSVSVATALSSVSVTTAPVATTAVATAPVATAPVASAAPGATAPVIVAPVLTAPVTVIAPVATLAPVATAPAPVAAVPVTVVHRTEWHCARRIAMNHLNNRDCAPKPWQLKDVVGEVIMDYFLLVFPPKQLLTMLQLTNESLLLNRKKAMTI
jgi:hypothetical protein